MNGGPDSTEHHSHRLQRPPRQGRHRQGAAGTWTPSVPTQPTHGRHEEPRPAAEAAVPLDASFSGSLPLAAGQPEHDSGYRSGFLSTRGELPIEVPAQTAPASRPVPPSVAPESVAPESVAPESLVPESLVPESVVPESTLSERAAAERAAAESAAMKSADEPTVRRRTVTLTTPPEPRPSEVTGEDILVYEAEPAPALDGLGTFDLGSVPASVTPPRTWRKAAWFATASSGFVVVALLFAGSVLVSQPSETGTQAINGWTERGGQPTLEGEQFTDRTSGPDSSTQEDTSAAASASSAASESSASSSQQTTVSERASAIAPRAPGAPPMTSSPEVSEAPTTTSTSSEPTKPPVSKAQRAKAPPRHVMTADPELMADRSEYFLNTVTEDPAAAHSVTTGELEEQGPKGLERKYRDVAYYEVKKIYIDPNRGETVNTVEVTYPDGSKKTEQRVLHFGRETKIESDGK